METIVINSISDFNIHFNQFKETARVISPQHTFVVGLDTEYICKANYPEAYGRSLEWIETNSNTGVAVCTIQLATDKMCLVINLVNMGKPMPRKLKELLIKDSWVKVGVGIDLDLRYLSENYNLGHCGGSIELKNLANLAQYQNSSLDFLFNQFVGGNVKKQASGLCDWTQELTQSQIEYAAKDAIMSLKIFQSIIAPTIDYLKQKKPEDNLLAVNIVNIPKTTNLITGEIKTLSINYIGKLNEYSQQNKLPSPQYTEKNIDGIPIMFQSKCNFNGKSTIGNGSSKKKAKNLAAQKMLKMII